MSIEKELLHLTRRTIALESTRATKVELDAKLNTAMVVLDKQFTAMYHTINAHEKWLQKCDEAIKELRKSPTTHEKKSLWKRIINSI